MASKPPTQSSEPGIGLDIIRISNRVNPVFKAAVDSGRIPGIAGIALKADGQVLFRGGFGKVDTGDKAAADVTVSTPTYVFSCTKLITSVAALFLIEKGELRLDDAVKTYVPEIEKVQILKGFDSDGKPILSPQQQKPTILNLLTHTMGFTYDFFDKNTLQYQIATGGVVGTYGNPGLMSQFMTPLLFEPGYAYNYGINTDWLGLVIQKVTGLRMDKFIQQTIIDPLGLKNTGFGKNVEAGKSFFKVHLKDKEGKLTPTDTALATDPEVVGGGHFITTTVEDYTQFLLAILNYGTHPVSKVTLLKRETVQEYIFKDQLPGLSLNPNPTGGEPGIINSSVPQLSRTGEFLPGVQKGWSLALMTNADADLPNGRKAGSGAWTGLNNTYYWMDPASGVLGAVFSSIFPFFDPDVLHCFDALERAVYDKRAAKVPGEPGSNFKGGEWAE